MNLDRWLEDLGRLRGLLTQAEYRRWCGLSARSLTASDREQLADLTRADRLRELGAALAALDDDSSRWVAWHIEQLALRVHTAEVRRECEVRMAEQSLEAAGEVVSFNRAEPWLAGIVDDNERRRAGAWIEQGSAVWEECLQQLETARVGAREVLGMQPGYASWGLPRRRTPAVVAEQAAGILDASARCYRDALAQTLEEMFPSFPSRPGFETLPGFLAAVGLEPGLPAADQQLGQFVLAGLGLDQLLQSRLGLDLDSRPARCAGARVFTLDPGADVRGCWMPQAVVRDYRGVLRVVGAALPAAIEEGSDHHAWPVGDPAVGQALGGLLEGLVADSGWLQHTLHQSAPAWLVRLWHLQLWLRLRQLAAVVVAGRSDRSEPQLPVSIGRELTDATGFTHPAAPLPWSDSWGAAADELTGWLAAASLHDHLATRFGSDWWRRAAAGRTLRDVLAAGPHGDVAAMCRELGLDDPSPDALLDGWLPRLGH